MHKSHLIDRQNSFYIFYFLSLFLVKTVSEFILKLMVLLSYSLSDLYYKIHKMSSKNDIFQTPLV